MSNFIKDYRNFESLNEKAKENAVIDCARFYENKAVGYIVANLPKKKQKEFSKEPLEVIFVDKANKNVSFGNNVLTVLDSFLNSPKKEVFFNVAQNAICAVFVNLFYNTASDPNKKTSFGKIANGFMATITAEHAKNTQFENDMMAGLEEILGEVMEMGPEQ